MGNNNRWKPPSADQKHDLELLFKEIPTETVVQVQWNSPEGQAFVKAARKVQLTGVSMPLIAEALGVSLNTLQGAVRYWERPSPSRGAKRRVRQPRPLGRSDG